ncbi:calmodulin-4 [Dorcoceras hygrometricum]|uniref:Calmodulin-4 n=1 Tax=Dorcoceras hygrometricum TaxID=472368 RepID=A0A2Z7BQI5_9LAMI|nr:calmodulin-4 [Dorcoceras hygrometricum]
MCPTGETLRRRGGKTDLRSAFDVLDADGDGRISHEDLRAFYVEFSEADATSGEQAIESMIAVADSNKDGFVEYDEFEKVLGAKKGTDRRTRVMEDAFRVMDKDGDGKVGHADLKSYLSWAGFEAADEDVKAMIRLGGGGGVDNGDGGVTFQGFLKILAL